MPFETALGWSDLPCELPGHGFISSSHAREVMTAPGSIWQTVLADLTTGRAVAVSRSGYRPTREMVEYVRAVDGTCRGPGCTVEARRCDLDHDVPWPHGPTDATNLSAKHRQHHRVKTAGWWDASRDGEALVTWRTAAGRTYTTHPKDWLEGHRRGEAPPTAARPSTQPEATAPTAAVPAATDPDPPPF